MIFTVFCCIFMNHCNPDSLSTKTFHSSLQKNHHPLTHKTCLFNNSSLQKIHISFYPEHDLSFAAQRLTYPLTKTCHFSMALPQKIHISLHTNPFFQRPFHRIFTYHLTQSMSFQYLFSTEKSFTLSPKTCLFTCLRSQRFTYPLTKTCLFSKALPQKIHISSHTHHAFFQRLFHIKFTHPLSQHMSFYMSSFNETKSAYVKELPRKGNPV